MSKPLMRVVGAALQGCGGLHECGEAGISEPRVGVAGPGPVCVCFMSKEWVW